MTERELKYLADIYYSIQYIEEFILDLSDPAYYSNDRKTKSAVERELSIIGEAVGQLNRLNPEIGINSKEQIIAFRNLVIHSYHHVNDLRVLETIQNDLPILKKEVLALLIENNINPDEIDNA